MVHPIGPALPFQFPPCDSRQSYFMKKASLKRNVLHTDPSTLSLKSTFIGFYQPKTALDHLWQLAHYSSNIRIDCCSLKGWKGKIFSQSEDFLFSYCIQEIIVLPAAIWLRSNSLPPTHSFSSLAGLTTL